MLDDFEGLCGGHALGAWDGVLMSVWTESRGHV